MSTKRLVVCLDVKAGRVVKGRSFGDLRDVGDPVELARRYEAEGADEIVFLDVAASAEERAPLWDVATRTAEQLFVPLVIGGGLGSLADAQQALRAGADKVAFNSAAVRDPSVITACARALGSQCVVVSIDAARHGSGWRVFTHGGTRPTGLDAVAWARQVVQAGAGELLVTSIDRDGQRAGYDLELIRAIADAVAVPVIASGGAGTAEHVIDAFVLGQADAALLAGILHDGTTTVGALKARLQQAGLDVRTGRPVRMFAFDLDAVDFSKGPVPVVAQDATTGAVLMVAYADRQALGRTIETGFMHYRSRTRGLWQKGETSGNVQQVISLALDCDRDTVLARVQPAGPACHTGQCTCFGAPTGDELSRLAATVAARAGWPPDGSYTSKLLGDRNLRLKKLGEEAAELVLALADGDGDAAVDEAADVIYHVLVALQAQGRTLDDVRAVLAARRAARAPVSD